jgi:hypothetical protein
VSITALVATKTQFKQRGWSFGYCTDCQGEGPIRIEEYTGTQQIGPFVIARANFGDYARCDFCECILPELRKGYFVDLDTWQRGNSPEQLAELLGYRQPISPGNIYQKHYAVLWGILWTTKAKELDIRSDLYVGLLLGAVVGAVLGYAILGHVGLPLNLPARLAIGSFAGLLLGGTLGSLISIKWQQSSLGFAKLCATHDRYPLDCTLLQRIVTSERMERRIRRMVSRFAVYISEGKNLLR